jgi:hypothetical protein
VFTFDVHLLLSAGAVINTDETMEKRKTKTKRKLYEGVKRKSLKRIIMDHLSCAERKKTTSFNKQMQTVIQQPC